MQEQVILVDQQDREIGVAEKLEAHRKGKLHRAFSVFLFNAKDEMLLQQRAAEKYHSGGLWSNACCSHPRPGEQTEAAARRRLREEMGISCNLNKAFDFIYRAEFDNGLIEHELDHVFIGRYDGAALPDPGEVMAHRWVSIDTLKKDLAIAPENFTAWFKIAVHKVLQARSGQSPSSA